MNLTSTKPDSTYSPQIDKIFKLLTISEDDATLLGSFTFRSSRFPGDIDIHEDLVKCCSADDVAETFVYAIRRIVIEILTTPLTYFMELKAGLDERYNINTRNKQLITTLFENSLINNNEEKTLLDPNISDEVKKDVLRKHMVLRWSDDDILNTMKLLPGYNIITLNDAVKMDSPVNIEIITYLNGRFVEASNFFGLMYEDEEGNTHVMNIPEESYTDFENFFIKELKDSINKLLTSKLMYNPFKALKRMWSLARFTDDSAKVRLLFPMVSGNYSSIYQIKGDISTLVKLLEKIGLTRDETSELLLKELLNMKDRISYVLELDNSYLEVFNNTIDEIVNTFYAAEVDETIVKMKKIEKSLKEIINPVAEKFIKNNNLF